MSLICAIVGHKGKWSPWMRTYYCRWCHQSVIPKWSK